ncbi:iron-containing alcohol dehydrogenase, partial [Paenibacillus sepulcri]|nr:iron-containing alcohol dehydrogenase [Paenibacillus sepulcri]
MTDYSYYCNTRIEMGMGKSGQLPELLQSLQIGSSILLVSDPGVVRAGLSAPIQNALEASGYRVVLFYSLSQNPRDTECLAGARMFAEQGM